MWTSAYEAVCRSHPDLVAVYESREGALALLLRHELVAPPEDRALWLAATRRVARAVARGLRTAGFDGIAMVLQWQRRPEIGVVLRDWTCRYDGDPVRHEQLADLVYGVQRIPARPGLLEWYQQMAPAWFGAEPVQRRRLILRTHRWTVERVLSPLACGAEPAVEDLAPAGRLAWMLSRTLSREEVSVWEPWVLLTLADLRYALARPRARRTREWVRWLFEIPYSNPVNRYTLTPAVRPCGTPRRGTPGSGAEGGPQPARNSARRAWNTAG